jgi:hypothetical protein
MTSIRIVLALLAIVASSSLVSAEYHVELDLDGLIGEAPDTLDVEVGDSIAVDVWWTSDELAWLLYMQTVICDSAGGLEYATTDYGLDQCEGGICAWPPQIPAPHCLLLRAQYLEAGERTEHCTTPVLLATVMYLAAEDHAIERLSVDEGQSVCLTTSFQTYYAEGSIGAVIRIGGATSIRGTTWGAVKELFR